MFEEGREPRCSSVLVHGTVHRLRAIGQEASTCAGKEDDPLCLDIVNGLVGVHNRREAIILEDARRDLRKDMVGSEHPEDAH